MYFQNVHNVINFACRHESFTIYWPDCGDKRNKRMRKQKILEHYYKMSVISSRAVLQLWTIQEDLRSDMWSVKSCQFNQQSAQSQAVKIISGPLQNDNIMNSVVFIGPHSSGNSKHYKQLLVDVPSITYTAFIADPIRNLQWA